MGKSILISDKDIVRLEKIREKYTIGRIKANWQECVSIAIDAWEEMEKQREEKQKKLGSEVFLGVRVEDLEG